MAEPAPPDQLGEAAAGHAAAEGADVPADPTGGRPEGVVGILQHTEPDVSVTEIQHQLGVSDGVAHYVAAARKAMDSLTDAETGSGTTVAEHLIIGTWTTLSNMSDDDVSTDTSDDTDEQADELPPMVGGERV